MELKDGISYSINITMNSTELNSSTSTSIPGGLPPSLLMTLFVSYQVLGIPISALGILGNCISIYVWTRKKMQWGCSSTSCYLVALAFSDMIYLIVINIAVLLPKWLRLDSEGHLISIFRDSDMLTTLSRIGEPVINVLSNISIYLVVAFTTERFIAVTFPIRGMRLCTPKRALYIIVSIVLSVIVLHIPDFIAALPNMEGYKESSFYRLGYNWGVMVLIFAVIPILLLSVFNTMLIRSVIISSKMRRTMTDHTQRRNERGYAVVTLTVILIVILFFIFHTPAALTLCIYTYRKHAGLIVTYQELVKWRTAFTSINFLTIMNYSLNFLAYSACSARFRRITAQLFCGFKRQRNRQQTKLSSNLLYTAVGKEQTILNSEIVSEESRKDYPESVAV